MNKITLGLNTNVGDTINIDGIIFEVVESTTIPGWLSKLLSNIYNTKTIFKIYKDE